MDNETIATAAVLARKALALLDSVGASYPACFLQQAIDVMTNAPVPGLVQDVDAASANQGVGLASAAVAFGKS